MNDTTMTDMMVAALSDPFDDCHMGMTAENIAKKWEISREDQDKLAVESHRRAASAIENGHFKEQILPIEIKVKRDTVMFDTDETVRGDSTVDKLAKLRPVFDKEGTVTAANASSINDAAAAVVLMERADGGEAWAEATRASRGVQLCWCGPEVYGHRTGTGGAWSVGEDRHKVG